MSRDETKPKAEDGPAPARPAREHETHVVVPDGSKRIVVDPNPHPEVDTRQVGKSVDDESIPAEQDAELAGMEARNLTGRTLQGRYRLEHVLGSGGMGDVYLGVHLSLDMPIAVKVLHPHIAAEVEFARRFRREARAASLLHHRNVVQVLDFGADGDLLYMVMELLHGQSAGEWLLELRDPPPLAAVREIMLQLLDAFEAAHTVGIVHRDLKPENIFLTEESDGRQVLKVVDFGLARLSEPIDQGPAITQNDVVSGTPEYMSPEQCRSLSVGPSTDLYAIGCVLTALLQLEPPFLADTSMQVITRQMFWPPPELERPYDAEPVPPLLERLRLDLLAKNAGKRPKDVSEVRARFLEAMSRQATAERLPPRKADAPAGTREERAPAWTHAMAPVEPRAGEQTTRVALKRLTGSPDGVMTDCAVGLAAHGLAVEFLKGEATPEAYDLAILDADDRLDEALGVLKLWQQAGGPRTIVCANDLGTAGMNQLIAAGVGDVVTYPVDVDVLLRKLKRLRRRKR